MVVSNGLVHAFDGSGTTYFVLLRPEDDPIRVEVPANAATAANGHGNIAATPLEIHQSHASGHRCGSGSGIASLVLGLLAASLLLLARCPVKLRTSVR